MDIKTIKVLLVENNIADANLIIKLYQQKFNIKLVKKIDLAIASLSEDNFDAIFLSVSNDQVGLANLKLLYQQNPQLPIIILSNTDELNSAQKYLSKGAQDYLIKSEIENTNLINAINYAIERQRVSFNLCQLALMKKTLDRIRNSIDLEAILTTTAKEIQAFLNTEQVLIYRCESGQSEATTVVAQSLDAESKIIAVEQFISAVNLSSLHSILTESTSVKAVSDTTIAGVSELEIKAPDQIRSYLILPIWLSKSVDNSYDDLTCPMVKQVFTHNQDEGLWGMLIAYNSNKIRKWQEWEINFLQRLTTQVTVAIQQSQLCCQLQTANQKLQQLAILDGLTGIANRRYFDLVLNNEWQRLAREKQPLSLILCDLDYFKSYNDTYGHQQGDRCLQDIARILHDCIQRPADLAARYGGEEFAIILPNTDLSGALYIAQKIVQQLAQAQIPHQKSLVSSYVTFSIGIATKTPDGHQAATTLIALADSFLYQAKKAGRNQIIFSTSNVRCEKKAREQQTV